MATVADVLRSKGDRPVVSVAPDMTVLAAVQLMNQHHIGAVVVSDVGQAIGIFTERDVMNRVVAVEKDPATTRVRDVMTSPVACGTTQTKLAECGSVMTRKKIRHLPIVEEGRLVGIISIGDILAREVQEQQETIQYLHQYINGRT